MQLNKQQREILTKWLSSISTYVFTAMPVGLFLSNGNTSILVYIVFACIGLILLGTAMFLNRNTQKRTKPIAQKENLPTNNTKAKRRRPSKSVVTAIFLLLAMTTKGQYNETRTVIYTPEATKEVQVMQPGTSVQVAFTLPVSNTPMRNTLRVVGGVQMPAPYTKRGEEMFRQSEYHLDDNLDSVHVRSNRYSLYFKGENDDFARTAWNRIPASCLQEGTLTVRLPYVKRQAFKVEKGGSFGVQLGLYYEKPGRAATDVYDEPDTTLVVSIPDGTGVMKDVTARFNLPQGVTCALLAVGGDRFTGECWLEAPVLERNRKTVWEAPFVKFAQQTDELNYWVGCNLSDRSWPYWQLTYNDKVVFEGKVFDRASNIADFYLPLPAEAAKGGNLKLTLVKEAHRKAYPYDLRSIEILQEPARDYEIIYTPHYVSCHQSFGVLVETNRPDVTLTVTAPASVQPRQQTVTFAETGLHVVQFTAQACEPNVPLHFSDGTRKETTAVGQIVERASEPIYLSVGDDIYLDKQIPVYTPYFKWYVSQRAGNWLQFRPSYQWSGVRKVHATDISYFTRLLNQLNMPYAWQVEGRTLAGKELNPPVSELASPMFMGKQAHENDGGYCYWSHFKYQGLWSDMVARHRPLGGIFAKHRPIYTDHGTFIHYDTQGVTDMAQGAQYFVDNLRYSKGESTRHTGPSTLFRYFYQAGYDWVGAEQMYGPEEVILSALRGASKAYSKPIYGSLHAMQWGSFPFTTPQHAQRLYLSLALAYMYGSSHINTEDALWTDEYAHDRYSESGKAHLDAQHRVLDFVETHTRRGSHHTDIAVLQGRNCAWKSFGRSPKWNQEGEKWKFDKADESFDLLKVFYPNNEIDGCGSAHWFTHTPYGSVDILPVEASREQLAQYRLLLFLGWNTYDKADFDRLREYVHQGGTLLLTAAHINSNLQPDEAPQFPADDAPVRLILGEDYRELTVVTERTYGLGKVVYFPQATYPADEVIRSAYTQQMQLLAADAVQHEAATGWIDCGEAIDFAAWTAADRKTLYVLNTDWQEARSSDFTLLLGNHRFALEAPLGQLLTIHCAQGIAVMPQGNTTDVLSITPTRVRIQTTGPDSVIVCNAETGATQTVAFDKAGIHEMEI